MSTFDGIVKEFPFIQIDYFRRSPERPLPLACFLSHVHSDHLQGLESFRAPFVYCSIATRELLLRIEKYPHRMNFNNGILESRRLHYKHLSKLLRPIPLNTPTEIDLTPRLSIRVTLLDANHCTGAVMFLIEGGGKAILYTGDIRAETWWVNSLTRHPVLIPYTLGNKQLDTIYLDTTFARASDSYRTFPSKAEGIAELLRKIESYPEDTTFYFRAWTFGYEEVWMALSAALNSKVHVDRYQLGLFRSLSSASFPGGGANEVPYLCGFEFGNRTIPGFLSEDKLSRVHSCEPGVCCPILKSAKTVYIVPIVNWMKDGSKVPEVGAGGGRGDLYQVHELEVPDRSALEKLDQLCRERIHDVHALRKARQALAEAFGSKGGALPLDGYGMKDAHDMPLEKLVEIISRDRPHEEFLGNTEKYPDAPNQSRIPLSRTINFPYSRHSSYTELCELVSAFKPKDIHPCTVDPLNWSEDVSMENLFGHLCSGTHFANDEFMRHITPDDDEYRSRKRPRYDMEHSTQSTQQSSRITDSDSETRASQNPPNYEPEIPRSAVRIDDNAPSYDTGHIPAAPESYASKPGPQNPISQNEYGINNSSSQLPVTRAPLPSSLEAIDDPLHIRESSPGTTKVRRGTIRQAWNALKDTQFKHGAFHLGPLPSSWPNNEESTAPSADQSPTTDTNNHTQEISQIGKAYSQDSEPVGASNSFTSSQELPTEASSAMETRPNFNTYIDPCEPPIHPSSQISNTLSVGSSAFTSQDQGLPDPDGLEEELADGYAALSNEHVVETLNDDESSTRPSARVRRAAYVAARADSYDAWASISLVSAGNNHTEEEIEL